MTGVGGTVRAQDGDAKKKQEYYEYRIYRVKDAEKQKIVLNYVSKALVPALNRIGSSPIGVFTDMKKTDDLSVHVLIPYATTQAFSDLNPKLQADAVYQKAAGESFACPKKDPAYTRVESRFMKAFTSIPVIELPKQTPGKKPRMFEVRIYEAHNEERAAGKVDMFDTGETQVMRDTGLAPVFFGETLIGPDVPNLTYMLSAANEEEHKAHWKAFMVHPEWQRMKKLPKYKDTVSKITNYFLVPADCSQI
jgi:hypothetical protein